MKIKKLLTTACAVFAMCASSLLFAQIQNPISSGTYKVTQGKNFDKVVVDNQKIVSYNNEKPLYAFFLVEEKLGQYILEITAPNQQSVDANPKRDRRLVVAKIEYKDEKTCKLSLSYSNGAREQITLEKM